MAELETQVAFPLGDVTDDEDNRVISLLKAWASTFQSIEDTTQDMILQKNVNDAVGAQLDSLGKLVGQERSGLSDADYRRYISAKITTNSSNGVFEDLILIAKLVVNDPALLVVAGNEGTATVQILISGVPLSASLSNILFLFLNKAKSGGVRLELTFNSSPLGNQGYFDNFNGTIADSTFTMFDTLP